MPHEKCGSTVLFGLWLALLATTVLAGPVPDSSGCNAEETLTRLEEKYRQQGPISFSFRQRTVSTVFGKEHTQDGKAWLDPAGWFRVEVGKETFVYRQDTLWHYVPANRQVMVRLLDSSSRAGLPPDLLWDLRRDFLPVDCRPDTLDKTPYLCVRAVARTPSAAIQRLRIWIAPQSFIVEHAEYIDYNDDRVSLHFAQMKKDRSDRGQRFHLDVPDSVEVVTLPAKKRQQNPTGPR